MSPRNLQFTEPRTPEQYRQTIMAMARALGDALAEAPFPITSEDALEVMNSINLSFAWHGADPAQDGPTEDRMLETTQLLRDLAEAAAHERDDRARKTRIIFGTPWRKIADAVGVSLQRAQQKYGAK